LAECVVKLRDVGVVFDLHFVREVGKRKSEMARDVLGRFLDERERERVMAEMLRAARFLSSDPDAVAENRQISEEFAVADAESLEIAEGPDVEFEKWWD
jgi:hypothetical protein